MFQKLGAEDRYLNGKRAVVLLGKSGLPQETLAKVWTLADSDCDGRLCVKEFCVAMHLIACVRKGLPLPELPTKVTAKKKLQQSKKQHAPATTKPRGAEGESQSQAAAKSPKRRSRLASLVQCEEPQNDKGASISTPNTLEPRGSGQVLHSVGCMLTSATRVEYNMTVETSRTKEVKNRDHAAPNGKRKTKLRQLDAKDVDAVLAEGQGAINSLRDVQSWRILAMGLRRLSGKDMARRIPVKVPPRRRHTLPLATKGELVRKQEFLPGKGRRTSLLGTAYEPAACYLRQRADKESAREVELEKATAKAAEDWKLKPLPENAERGATDKAGAEQADHSRGNLNVAGLPLLDEDIDVIVHLLRQNHAFKKLDLSRCFLSEKHFVSLAQALAWNSRIEELHLQECVFTGARTAALADVLTVNKHIHNIDVRGCKGLDENSIKLILRTARKKGNLLTFNGMELAALRVEGSNELDLSG
ncbi:unnamed protein product [Pylaiella littoralis]